MLSHLAKVQGVCKEEDQELFRLHSLSSGGVSEVAARCVTECLFQAHGGRRSRDAMLPFLIESAEAHKGVTGVLEYLQLRCVLALNLPGGQCPELFIIARWGSTM